MDVTRYRPSLTSVDVTKYRWDYISEGNLNIILGRKEIGKVIRVRKAGATEFSIQQQKHFIDNVVRPLLPDSEYALEMEIVPVPRKFLEDCQAEIETARPGHRAWRKIDLTQPSVQLLPHLCTVNESFGASSAQSVCIEIKPKCGFVPSSSYISGNHFAKLKTCRFCMMQLWKLHQGKISQISPYCPLDLFNGCSCRFEAAFENLLLVPQNNLVLHVDGVIVPASDLTLWIKDHYGTIQSFVQVVSKIFYEDSSPCSRFRGFFPKGCTSKFLHDVDCHGKALVHKTDCIKFGPAGILNCVRSLQMLDSVDIEGIDAICRTYDWKECAPNLIDFDSALWRNFAVQQATSNSSLCAKASALNEIQKYLISVTMKDLSIAVVLTEILPSQKSGSPDLKTVASTNGKVYAYSLKMIDLDPKSPLKIPEYAERDHDIVKTYTKLVYGIDCCVSSSNFVEG